MTSLTDDDSRFELGAGTDQWPGGPCGTRLFWRCDCRGAGRPSQISGLYRGARAGLRARQLQKCFIATHRIRKRPSWFPIPMALYGCRTMGFAEPLPTRPLPIKQALRLPCNGQSRFSAFRRPPRLRHGERSPRGFLLAEEDRMINPKSSAIHGRSHGVRSVQSHSMDHSPMYTEPNLVIDVILEAARQTLSRQGLRG